MSEVDELKARIEALEIEVADRIDELADKRDEIKQRDARIADLEWELMLHQTGWARAPDWAMFRATDASGFRCWYSKEPKPHDGKWWFKSGSFHEQCDTITPPADFTQTLEPRPAREAKS